MFTKDGRFVRFLAAALHVSQKLVQGLPDELGSVLPRTRGRREKVIDGGEGVLINSHRNGFHIRMIPCDADAVKRPADCNAEGSSMKARARSAGLEEGTRRRKQPDGHDEKDRGTADRRRAGGCSAQRGRWLFQVRMFGSRHLVDVRPVETLPSAQRIAQVLVIAPADLIAGKVVAYHQRRGQPKSGTDRPDLAVLR